MVGSSWIWNSKGQHGWNMLDEQTTGKTGIGLQLLCATGVLQKKKGCKIPRKSTTRLEVPPCTLRSKWETFAAPYVFMQNACAVQAWRKRLQRSGKYATIDAVLLEWASTTKRKPAA